MPRRITQTTLNASTIDIINVIRKNASYQYQSLVPQIDDAIDIPKVGEVLYGTPALANEFLNSLINRIALVSVKSATFNNAYAELKKGYLEFGETIEEVFVNICKAREFSPEKAEAREFKRSLPDVRSAFHVINWKVQYPVTISQEELRQAFMSAQGVQDLVAKIISAVSTAAEYDEYLLFKYLMIKAITHGMMYPVAFDATDIKNAAKTFRATSNQLTFMSQKYNSSGVHTTTPRNEQYIFMDSTFNAAYDVDVLASAFNMDKATFEGNLKLIDDWTTFDNDRFSEIKAGSDMIEDVTADELALMANVKAVICDKEWFQVYDNLTMFTDKQVASGLYWNYFLNVWKTVSSSPFSNAIVFVDDAADVALPSNMSIKIESKDVSPEATVFTLALGSDTATLKPHEVEFVQTQALTTAGIAVQRYGALIIPTSQASTAITLVCKVQGVTYTATTTITASSAAGDTVTVSK